jgi:hypothetical protein
MDVMLLSVYAVAILSVMRGLTTLFTPELSVGHPSGVRLGTCCRDAGVGTPVGVSCPCTPRSLSREGGPNA